MLDRSRRGFHSSNSLVISIIFDRDLLPLARLVSRLMSRSANPILGISARLNLPTLSTTTVSIPTQLSGSEPAVGTLMGLRSERSCSQPQVRSEIEENIKQGQSIHTTHRLKAFVCRSRLTNCR